MRIATWARFAFRLLVLCALDLLCCCVARYEVKRQVMMNEQGQPKNTQAYEKIRALNSQLGSEEDFKAAMQEEVKVLSAMQYKLCALLLPRGPPAQTHPLLPMPTFASFCCVLGSSDHPRVKRDVADHSSIVVFFLLSPPTIC